MFKDHDNDSFSQQEGDTVIGGSIKIEGDLASQGNIIIEGQVVGSVKTESHLTIGQQARVDAEVQASDANVSGEVNGNMSVSGKLELAASAKVNGDIKAKILRVEEGAIINGKVEMEGASLPEFSPEVNEESSLAKDSDEKGKKQDKKDKKSKKENEDEVDF